MRTLILGMPRTPLFCGYSHTPRFWPLLSESYLPHSVWFQNPCSWSEPTLSAPYACVFLSSLLNGAPPPPPCAVLCFSSLLNGGPPLLVRYYVFPPYLMEAPPPCAVLCFSYLLNGAPPPPLCGTMFSTTRTGLPSGTLRAKFMEHSLVHESAISVYTDGSNCAKVWAFVTVFPHKVISDRLPSVSSVFAAELWAVLPVVALMLRLFGTEFVVYSDPQNALRSIGHPFCHHPFVQEIHRWLRTLRDRGKALHFCWVPGTVGVTGNGKAATTHNRIAPTRLLARDYYSHFSAALRRRWLTS